MSSSMRPVLAMLIAMVVSPIVAATGSSPVLVTRWQVGDIPEGTAGLEELDEVLVRAKRTAIVIADLEDEYYKLYNKLNKDKNYDVHCSYLNTDPDNVGSRLQSRVCMPEFLTDAMVDWAQGRCDFPDFTSLDLNKDHSLSEAEAAGNLELSRQLWDLDTNHDKRLVYTEFVEFSGELPTACYQPPPPELVLAGRTEKWYRQMLKVTTSDERLLKMASYLGDLYGQLRVLQKHAGKLEARAIAQKVKQ